MGVKTPGWLTWSLQGQALPLPLLFTKLAAYCFLLALWWWWINMIQFDLVFLCEVIGSFLVTCSIAIKYQVNQSYCSHVYGLYIPNQLVFHYWLMSDFTSWSHTLVQCFGLLLPLRGCWDKQRLLAYFSASCLCCVSDLELKCSLRVGLWTSASLQS